VKQMTGYRLQMVVERQMTGCGLQMAVLIGLWHRLQKVITDQVTTLTSLLLTVICNLQSVISY
jgi:hypothetical protein